MQQLSEAVASAVLADGFAHRVVGLLQSAQRLRQRQIRRVCMMIAALTFHFARLSSASAVS